MSYYIKFLISSAIERWLLLSANRWIRSNNLNSREKIVAVVLDVSMIKYKILSFSIDELLIWLLGCIWSKKFDIRCLMVEWFCFFHCGLSLGFLFYLIWDWVWSTSGIDVFIIYYTFIDCLLIILILSCFVIVLWNLCIHCTCNNLI